METPNLNLQPKQDDKCPECGGDLNHSEGCTICINCGWGGCSN